MTTRKIAVAMTLGCGLMACALSPAARAEDGQFTIGSQWWTQTVRDAKFDEFRDVPRGGFLESFLLREWSGRNSVVLWGANGIRADQATRFTWANGARWRMDLGYTQIPHTFSHLARSPYVQTSAGWFTLPDSLQAKNQASSARYTATMSDLLKSAPVIPLTLKTNISTARMRARPAKGWQFEVRGTERERSGQKPYAMTFGFSTAIEIPEPIDQRMLDADVIANYQHDRMTAQVDVGLSRFDNAISTLRVDNPKRLTDVNGGDGPKVGALDLYPDNRVVRGTVALGYRLPKRTALAATLGISQGKQDDAFLPMTNNSALAQSSLDSLPARSANAKVKDLSGDVRLTTNPVEKLQGSVRFHYTDHDNQTPELDFIGQIPYDVSFQRYASLTTDARTNKQWQGGLDLDYSLASSAKLGATYEYRVRERTFREIEKDKEGVYSARAHFRPTQDVQIDGKYWHGDRKLDAFLDEEYVGYKQRAVGPTAGVYDSLAPLELAGLRRYDVANRVQDKATAGVSYALGEHAELSASYIYLKNDYKDTTFGLKDETSHTVAGSGTIHVSERLDLDGGYGFERGVSDQASRESNAATLSTNPLDNWNAHLKDIDVFVSAGFDWIPREKLTLGAHYVHSRHVAEFDLTNGRGTAQDLPTTVYRSHDATLEAGYRWTKNTTLAGRYGWEEYDSIDFATNDVPLIFPLTGTASAIFLGDSSQGYRAHRIALLVRHSF